MVVQISDIPLFKQKALRWANGFDVACCLDSNNFTDRYTKFDVLIAAGVKDELTVNAGTAFNKLEAFREKHKGYITGFMGYDLKNEIESLTSENVDGLAFPDLYFFAPEFIVRINGEEVNIIGDNADIAFSQILNINIPNSETAHPDIDLKTRFTRQQYLDTANKIKKHISRGDIYVTNFCQEFYAEGADIDPLATFFKLNHISPNPFSCFFKLRDKYILCASPERFLAKRDTKLISQPIKGTIKRGTNASEDLQNKQLLKEHVKELQENVMIVDLVRNDLTRSASPGSVKTEELFGIYSFAQVHQMISTVVCELDINISAVQSIKNAFPMGSMTGAPKVSSMKLMEQYELSKRGVYSGAIGYFDTEGDFDFNVVIRTLLYDADTRYLSFQTGSAITINADTEQEYEECLLKAKAVLEALGKTGI
ncbi:aminodeoxychorismate synthase component I [Mucilaginibacter hurinus]|uniref:Aminodeoxychorismate synthase component I n=1 Tax=Mucilaginibacter hurinus TaxID=2201324 RepID=A0A367GSU0_9SPHI|nr:anthranilate synthase component I family protein [Mucilaginibacter hurinus]RCH56494.1 aminodeoxychorismate synthase component I [Mucilaginibacter hurinus]